MQTRYRLFALIAVAFMAVLSSCSKSNKQGRFIPKDAAIAVIVNGKSLSEKLPWDEVKKSKWYQIVSSDTTMDAVAKSVLENPDNTGIDTKQDLIFFAVKDSVGGYLAFEGTVKDPAVFKKVMLETSKGSESEKDGVHFIESKQMTISWKDERFIIAADAPFFQQKNIFNENDGNKAKRDVKPVCSTLYDLKEKNSLSEDEKLTDILKKEGDVYFFVNSGSLYNGSMATAALSMLNISKLYDGSFMTGVLNFDKGKATIDLKSYSGKEMNEIVKKYSASSIDKDMVKRIPTKNIGMILAFSFKPEGLKEFLKLSGLEGFANMGTGYLGFSVDDFIKANKGDVLLCLSDAKTDSNRNTDMKVLFAASIGDRDAFNKLVTAGQRLGKEAGEGVEGKFFYQLDKSYFVIGNEKPYVDQYIANSANNSFDVVNKMSDNPMVIYADLQHFMKGIGQNQYRDSLDNILFNTSLKTWDNVSMWGGKYNDGAVDSHIELNFVDKNTNSLKQINDFFGVAADVQKQKEARWNTEPAVEAEPVPDAAPVEEAKP